MPNRQIIQESALQNRRPNSPVKVAALCVSGRSIYKHLPDVEAYDSQRDARTFAGGMAVVAHPPCRLWSHFLRTQAKSPDQTAEKELGRFCVRQVLINGGVLEHPAESHLFKTFGLPVPNRRHKLNFDALGFDMGDVDAARSTMARGFFGLYVEQIWWGNAQRKATWLMIAGVPNRSIIPMPFSLVERTPQISLSHAGRSRTPNAFAEWLVSIARLANQPGKTV